MFGDAQETDFPLLLQLDHGGDEVFDRRFQSRRRDPVELKDVDGVALQRLQALLDRGDDMVRVDDRMLMRVGATTAVQNPTSMDITLEAHITDVEAIVTLFLRNFDTGLFELVGQFTNGLGVDTTNRVNVPDASRFVRPNGRIVLRVKKIVILPFTLNGFHSLEDLLEIVVH